MERYMSVAKKALRRFVPVGYRGLLVGIQLTLVFAQAQAVEKIYYYHNDHLGTPQYITNVNGNIVWIADMSPFMASQPPVSSVTNTLRFPGQYYDSETQLHYNWYRYYDPVLGRYIQSDPVGLRSGVNTYSYVNANPLKFVDPLGLDKTLLINTTDGRSIWDGPTNGAWGGKCWSGGGFSCDGKPQGDAKPMDSGDECYKRHDNCYSLCKYDTKCIASCDRQLVKELEALPDDPRNWPRPPRHGTEGDSSRYRNWAIQYFD